MNQTDLIILVVYLISITYVIYQAINSLEERTVIRFDQAALAQFLEQEKIADVSLNNFIDISFGIQGRYKFSQQPATLGTIIQNKSRTATVSIDWDNSSITNHAGRVRRVIRLTPGLQPSDLSEPQVKSTIPPSRNLQATLVPEDLLKPNADNTGVVTNGAIVSMAEVEKDKGTYAKFRERQTALQFSLRLLFQIINVTDGAKREYWCFVPCTFVIEKISQMDYLPWNPK
ncbi:MAG TPA: hypothetical protein V6D10_21325 [Trichocoleus sp.]|jgi:hypothetical protein